MQYVAFVYQAVRFLRFYYQGENFHLLVVYTFLRVNEFITVVKYCILLYFTLHVQTFLCEGPLVFVQLGLRS